MESIRKLIQDSDRQSPDYVVRRALQTVRDHLGMETAYLSEFVDGDVVFRAVESTQDRAPIHEGDANPLESVYCHYVNEGQLPKLMPDLAEYPLAAGLPVTSALPVGSHVSIPIRRDDGTLYGSFCCMSPKPNRSLNGRDLEVMELFASLASDQINGAMSDAVVRNRIMGRIRRTIDLGEFTIAFQPIYELGQPCPNGFEALARFAAEPYRPPNVWFDEADTVGLGLELELAAIKAALPALDELPQNTYLSVNASPETIASGHLVEIFEGVPKSRVVLEVTEHAMAASDINFVQELERLRSDGVQLAIDDAGAGYSGLSQIAKLSPNIIKLDRSLVTDIDSHKARYSLATAMVHFAQETEAKLIAEGIETKREYNALLDLGVERGQGYYLGRPGSLLDAVKLGSSWKSESQTDSSASIPIQFWQFSNFKFFKNRVAKSN